MAVGEFLTDMDREFAEAFVSQTGGTCTYLSIGAQTGSVAYESFTEGSSAIEYLGMEDDTKSVAELKIQPVVISALATAEIGDKFTLIDQDPTSRTWIVKQITQRTPILMLQLESVEIERFGGNMKEVR